LLVVLGAVLSTQADSRQRGLWDSFGGNTPRAGACDCPVITAVDHLGAAKHLGRLFVRYAVVAVAARTGPT
jgi:hypothetical protein